MTKIAFIGLGVMGFPMAAHLKKAGHDVCVFNRTTAKAEKWVQQHGGQMANTPKLAAENADFVFSCVGNDDDLRSVTLGENGAFHSIKQNAIFIDNTTASADMARQLNAHAKKNDFHFLDAPVSGGQAGAENAALTVMVGGEEKIFSRAKPIIAAYAKMVNLIGEVGSGQLAKMMNQICIAGLVQGLAEAIHLGQKANLDIEKVIETISKGAAGSWQMENRYKTMMDGEYNHGFAVEWMRKDLAICLAEAKKQGVSLPITAIVDQFYGDIENMGGKRWDTSSLLARLKK